MFREAPRIDFCRRLRKALEIGPKMLATAGKAYRAGVKIAFGTDAGVYDHGENAQEFVYMAQAGMPPMYTIQMAATHATALLERSQDLGGIALGNPLDGIALTEQVDSW